MSAAAQMIAGTPEGVADIGEMVLVVDDSRAQRRLLASYLNKWGYRVVEADSGKAALEICRAERPDLIVSDWMMPGMDGLEFCRLFREIKSDKYGYFVLLTSKSEKGAVARGLDVGADDFLTKPVNAAEFRARIRAGQRILKMERELTEKNRLVSATLAEIQVLYDAIDRDLIEARKFQQSLVPDRHRQFDGADVALMLHPSGHVGGDLVGVFPVNESQIGLYSIDVSGHGIASALMTARLAAYFSGSSPKQNIALSRGSDGTMEMRPPGAVIERLNALWLNEMETELYLTILLARADLTTGRVTMVQAGHPHPAILRADGSVEFEGTGGLPVGLIAGAEYAEFEVQLSPGDRLILGSDGITECADPGGDMLENDGFARILEKNKDLPCSSFFKAMMWDLSEFSNDEGFADDVSAVMLEYKGGS